MNPPIRTTESNLLKAGLLLMWTTCAVLVGASVYIAMSAWSGHPLAAAFIGVPAMGISVAFVMLGFGVQRGSATARVIYIFMASIVSIVLAWSAIRDDYGVGTFVSALMSMIAAGSVILLIGDMMASAQAAKPGQR